MVGGATPCGQDLEAILAEKKNTHPERAVALHPWKLERDLLPNKGPKFIEKIQLLLSGFS